MKVKIIVENNIGINKIFKQILAVKEESEIQEFNNIMLEFNMPEIKVIEISKN